MNTKNILVLVIALLVLGGGAYWYTSSNKIASEDSSRVASPNGQKPEGKLKAEVFSGKLEETNEGCFADGECYVVVDGKHVTVIMGWSQAIVGSIIGVESFGNLNAHIGEEFEVYAQDKGDGTYTLYGSEGFYVKLK